MKTNVNALNAFAQHTRAFCSSGLPGSMRDGRFQDCVSVDCPHQPQRRVSDKMQCSFSDMARIFAKRLFAFCFPGSNSQNVVGHGFDIPLFLD